MRICIYMVKVISLSNEAYETLSKIKGKDSFSQVVLRLAKGGQAKKPLSYFYGKLADSTFNWESLLEDRKKFKLRDVEL